MLKFRNSLQRQLLKGPASCRVPTGLGLTPVAQVGRAANRLPFLSSRFAYHAQALRRHEQQTEPRSPLSAPLLTLSDDGGEEKKDPAQDEKSEPTPAQPDPVPAQPQPQTAPATTEDEKEGGGGGGGGASGGEVGTPTEGEAEEAEEEVPDEDIYYGMTPREMIKELDRFVIGQEGAKKAVAIAWRARWRRQKLPKEPKDYRAEVMPKNILMIGPTGCGKTEVARRLAKVSKAPFVKVEATKFTEVGYVGKDVNSIIEDLVANAAQLVKTRRKKKMEKSITKKVEDIILKLLMGKSPMRDQDTFRRQLKAGMLDNFKVEIEVRKEPEFPQFVPTSKTLMILGGVPEHTTEKRMMSITNARKILMEQESKKLLSDKDIAEEAVQLAENDGIVFIDEIDKICGSRGLGKGDQKVSQEGVQRDLLPMIEGCSINVQNFGQVKTDHVLFICAGAFHDSKPADLMPEFQGRLPVRVKLDALSKADLLRILTETEFNLISQQIEMLKTENFDLSFETEAIQEIAEVAAIVNQTVENIGARRLVTVIEKVLEDINLDASDAPEGERTKVLKKDEIREMVGELLEKSDYTKYVL